MGILNFLDNIWDKANTAYVGSSLEKIDDKISKWFDKSIFCKIDKKITETPLYAMFNKM